MELEDGPSVMPAAQLGQRLGVKVKLRSVSGIFHATVSSDAAVVCNMLVQ